MTEIDPNSGTGWYEWIKMPLATTHVAYVHESGSIYLPENELISEDFLMAAAEGRVHRLIRADDLPPETTLDAWRRFYRD